MHLKDTLKSGKQLRVTGKGPPFEEFQRLASGLLPSLEWVSIVKHRFHFCVDGHHALILWLCRGKMYQKLVPLRTAEVILDDLERLGFEIDFLN
jgi:hypothetical protein